MPRTKISEFSTTAGDNTDIDGINIAEGCAPSGINDAIRELMAQLKDFQSGAAGDSMTAVGTLAAKGTSSATGDLKLYEDTDNGTNYVGFAAPASIAANVQWTLPSADGTSNQALITNGTGTLSFASFVATGSANTFTAAQTFRAANAIRSEAASTQDAVVIAGRAGGTSSYAVTLTPATLSASRTVTIPDETFTVGFRNLPAVGTKTGSYTLAVADVGKYVQVGSGGSITIPDATFAEGDAISIFNNTTGNITITCTITTAYIAGTDTDKATMTLATRGVATILFISSTICVISGNVS